MTTRTITMTTTDGRVVADGFPDEVDVTTELLQTADPRVMRADGDRLYFTLDNGRAAYERAGEAYPGATRFRRLHSRLEPAAA